MSLAIAYTWHPNYAPECERGSYLTFQLTWQHSSVGSTEQARRAQACLSPPGEPQRNHIVVPFVEPWTRDQHPHGPWSDSVLVVSMYSYNSVRPGMAGRDDVHSRVWTCQRTAYCMIPLCLAATKQRTFRMRSMMPSTQRRWIKGWFELHWDDCDVLEMADAAPPTKLETIPDALHLDLDTSPGKPPLSSSQQQQQQQQQQSLVHAIQASHVDATEWMQAMQQKLRQCNDLIVDEQGLVNTVTRYISVDLRNKYAATLPTPIGVVPCILNIIGALRRTESDIIQIDDMYPCIKHGTSMPVDVLQTLRAATAHIDKQGNLVNVGVDALELLHQAISFPASLRAYRLDAIDICRPPSPLPAATQAALRFYDPANDWFALVEADHPQHTPTYLQTDASDSDSDSDDASDNEHHAPIQPDVTASTSSNTHVHNRLISAAAYKRKQHNATCDAENDVQHHEYCVSDQADHDHQGEHMAQQANDCESLQQDCMIVHNDVQLALVPLLSRWSGLRRRLYHQVLNGPFVKDDDKQSERESTDRIAVWKAITKLASKATTIQREASLLLALVARHYVLTFVIVASPYSFNSGDADESIRQQQYQMRTRYLDDRSSQTKQTNRHKTQTDPHYLCHVVGVWFPRPRWNTLVKRGRLMSSTGQAATATTLKQITALQETETTRWQPSGVCDTTDRSMAVQWIDPLMWTPKATSSIDQRHHKHLRQSAIDDQYCKAYECLIEFEHIRLLTVRKPRDYTKQYVEYGFAVTATTAHDGDLIFMDAVTGAHGVPFEQLLRPGIAHDADFSYDAYDHSSSQKAASLNRNLIVARPMTRPLKMEQWHALRELLHVWPTPRPLWSRTPTTSSSSTSFSPTASSSSFNTPDEETTAHTDFKLRAWMPKHHWLQAPSDASAKTYGAALINFCRSPIVTQRWRIQILPNESDTHFIDIYPGCAVKELLMFRK